MWRKKANEPPPKFYAPIRAQRWQADVQLEYKQQLNADLVAEKGVCAKAMEQFLIWKKEEV